MLHLLRPAALAGAVALCAASPEAAVTPDAPATPPAAPPAASAPAAPPAATTLAPVRTEEVAAEQVVALLGLAVNADDTREVGRIVDVLVDATGRPRAAVVDVGGFLGVGSRKVAVAWAALRFTLGKTPAATLAVASDLIKSAPAYDPAKPVEAVEAPQPVATGP